jgi:hypothetical protein
MKENKYNEVDNISYEELELIRNLSYMECIDDGIYPTLDFVIDMDEEEEKA